MKSIFSVFELSLSDHRLQGVALSTIRFAPAILGVTTAAIILFQVV